jgi:hypothetical protein
MQIRSEVTPIEADADIVRVQAIQEIAGAGDLAVLEWAASEDRVLFTRDVG